METTIMGPMVLGSYRNNGKDNGNCYIDIGVILGKWR